MGGFGVQRHEVPERVVRRLRLRDLAVGMGLARVDDVGELDAVLDEEHRDVVADQVEVALVGVELDRESAGVAHRVGRPARAQDRREPAEDLRLLALAAEEAGLGDRRGGAVGLEHAVRRGAAGVHDALGDALVVEVGDLLAQVEVLEKGRSAIAGLERVVGVGEPHALRSGQELSGLGARIEISQPHHWCSRSGWPVWGRSGRACGEAAWVLLAESWFIETLGYPDLADPSSRGGVRKFQLVQDHSSPARHRRFAVASDGGLVRTGRGITGLRVEAAPLSHGEYCFTTTASGPQTFPWSPWTKSTLWSELSMRKTIGVSLTALTLLFGGAGVAQATAPAGPTPSSTTTTIAADTDEGDSDNTGLWGLAGLLGLLGLAGLKRRNDRDVTAATAARGPNAPRV